MARIARVVVPKYPHHVTQRGNRRMKTFFCDEDYKTYIDLMADACAAAGTKVLAYCLMPNHVHFVMVPSHEDGLRAALGDSHRRYTRYVNFRKKWRGHLWQERFHSFPMDERYLIAAVRYIERNPVAEKLCRSPGYWKWSSAKAHLKGKDDQLVNVKPMLDLVGDWASFLKEKDDISLEEISLHSRTGRPLGTAAFVRRVERKTGRILMPQKPGRKKA